MASDRGVRRAIVDRSPGDRHERSLQTESRYLRRNLDFKTSMRFATRPKLLLIAIVALVGAGVLAWDWFSALPADSLARASFVGRATCAECHSAQHDLWLGSHHDRAMELATDSSVLGDFSNTTFERFGITTRFFRRDGKYYVNTEGPDGKYHDYEVKYTFGVDPLQQYMVELERGRVQVLRVSWDTEKKEWFDVTPPDVTDQRIEPGDPLHWTGIAQNWNTTCADCHSTDVHKNYDPTTDSYQTSYEEIDVSCEECHGPASVHVELARDRSLFWDRNVGYGLVSLKGADTTVQIELCAKCHSRRAQIQEGFRPGKPLLDFYEPALLAEGLYYANGLIQDEVYEYGSFLQSKMYANHVKCSDCHDPHSLRLKHSGNRLCAQCHEPGKYDTPAHHHHPAESTGAQCIECHMPSRLYMVIDRRHDHSFRIPRPDQTVAFGVPNACNDCHTKESESAEWAAESIRKWYGDKRRDDPHWAPALASGREGKADANDLLVELVRRTTTPSIVRATAFSLLTVGDDGKALAAWHKGLSDSDPLSRVAAVRTLSGDNLASLEVELASSLDDPIRAVRIAAASRLAFLPQESLPTEYRERFRQALIEFRASQELSLDHAGAHLAFATLERRNGRIERAIEHLQTAIRLEPYMSGARSELASLLDQLRGNADEIRSLREAEAQLLERDALIAPNNAAIFYQLGLTRYLLGELDLAAEALAKACALAPREFEFRMALALLDERRYELTGDESYLRAATVSLRTMEQLLPGDPRTQGIADRLLATQKARGGASK